MPTREEQVYPLFRRVADAICAVRLPGRAWD